MAKRVALIAVSLSAYNSLVFGLGIYAGLGMSPRVAWFVKYVCMQPGALLGLLFESDRWWWAGVVVNNVLLGFVVWTLIARRTAQHGRSVADEE